MPGTMKSLQVTTQREFTIRDLPIPAPGEGQVLMKVTSVTTCPQWDLHLRHNEPMFVGHQFVYPYTQGQPGHEAVGYVEALGAGVTGLEPGDRVCAWRDAGHMVPGCYAQFVVHEADNLIKVPAGLPDEALAPLELAMCVGTVFRMLRDMDVVQGRTVGITGVGPAGIIAAQMAKAEGADAVYGFDPHEERRGYAASVCFDECFDPSVDLSDRFPTRPNKPLIGTSVDCVGSKHAAEFLMDRTEDVVALFGVQREDFTYAVRHHTLRLCGYKGHHRESAEYALELIKKGTLDLSAVVTHSMPLEHYSKGIDLLENQEALKICFSLWEST